MSKKNGKLESLTLDQIKGISSFTAGDYFYGFQRAQSPDGQIDGSTLGINAVYRAAKRHGLTTAEDTDKFLDQFDGKDLVPLLTFVGEVFAGEPGPLGRKTKS